MFRAISTFLVLLLVSPVFAKVQKKSSQAPLERRVEQKIKAIATELRASQTIRDWVEKAPKKVKLQRRMHFSRFYSKKIPQHIVSGNKVVLYTRGINKAPDVFKIEIRKNKLVTLFNGRNITSKKNESFQAWVKRLFPKLQKQKVSSFSFFFPKAYAQLGPSDPDNSAAKFLNISLSQSKRGLWAAMMGAMDKEAWRNKNLKLDQPGNYQQTLLEPARLLKKYKGLTCGAQGEAHFDYVMGHGFIGRPVGKAVWIKPFFKEMRITASRAESNDSQMRVEMNVDGRKDFYEYERKSYNQERSMENYKIAGKTGFGHSDYNFYENFGRLLGAPANPNRKDASYYTSLETPLDILTGLSDIARACCSNIQCRGEAGLSVEPSGTETSN